MKQKGERTLSRILWELMQELTRLEVVARLTAMHMEGRGLEDEVSTLLDLCTMAGDWREEVASWIANLAREQEGNDE